MPTVADLYRLATELGARAEGAEHRGAVLRLAEAAEVGQVLGFARWRAGKLDVWDTLRVMSGSLYDSHRENPPRFSAPAAVPDRVVSLLQEAAASQVAEAERALLGAPPASTARDAFALANCGRDAAARIEAAAHLEAAAAACRSGTAVVYVSSRRTSWHGPPCTGGPAAAACILTPMGVHVCVQPYYLDCEFGYQCPCRVLVPGIPCERPNVVLTACGVRVPQRTGYERPLPIDDAAHPIILELVRRVADVARAQCAPPCEESTVRLLEVSRA